AAPTFLPFSKASVQLSNLSSLLSLGNCIGDHPLNAPDSLFFVLDDGKYCVELRHLQLHMYSRRSPCDFPSVDLQSISRISTIARGKRPGATVIVDRNITLATADQRRNSSLLPADYCQRERVSDVQRIQTEFVWKSPIRFSDKVLRLKVPTV